ncbi:DUF3500 domain-containing protein [Prosthecobacter vanneervenii]|uniref:DUF3500 domain-containing protein n=1 Tax=Prosthecobacter vanneervenii TaxID=48466 RepID=A0A7W8DJ56_9BACT|nr:DUF3500 domain-containing protein [Prosthecobacter vanneervenii]MBB5031788.1 hypothetical protein [Prosthecobacter vanneervenii]
MMNLVKRLTVPFFGICLAFSCIAPQSARAHEAGAQMSAIAKVFLSALTPEQKAKASFEFGSEERENWHFIPRERKGLPMKEMTPQQRLLAQALLNTGLGFRGAAKAVTIMSLEEVLYQIEGADESKRAATREKRDPEKYYVSIFGEPADKGAWGWRVEGHHLSLNFTIKDGQMLRATPSFMGTNPGEIRQGPLTGLRVLGVEEELGRELVKSLSEEQFKKAFVATEAPKEMITEAKHKVDPLSPEGIADTDLDAKQKGMLKRLIDEYVDRLRPEIADAARAEFQASGPIHFAWAGGKERGEPHYYRVQGKTFLLEYDNTQNNANHVHSVWRSFDGDFGRDVLGEHVKQAH